MSIERIRELLFKEQLVPHSFLYVGSRGMQESFCGKIVFIYSRIFMIQTLDGNWKSFSYSDFLIHSLKIVG